MDERERRMGKNEAAFRKANERLRELAEGFSVVTEQAQFICECPRRDCMERIRLSLEEYEHVRSDPTWFVVVKGHESVDVERVVEEHENYYVVEKLAGAAEAASAEDPRS